jgi:hypothetical protein
MEAHLTRALLYSLSHRTFHMSITTRKLVTFVKAHGFECHDNDSSVTVLIPVYQTQQSTGKLVQVDTDRTICLTMRDVRIALGY